MENMRGLRTKRVPQSSGVGCASHFKFVMSSFGLFGILICDVAHATDLTMVVESALKTDHAVRVAQAQLEEATALVWVRRSSLLPMVAIQGDATINENEIAFDPLSVLPDDVSSAVGSNGSTVVVQPKEVYAATLVAKTPILDLTTWRLGGVAEMQMREKETNVEKVKREVTLKSLSVTSSLLLARDAQLLASEQSAQLQGLVAKAEKEEEAGLISRGDLLAVQLRASEASEDVAKAAHALIAAQSQFSTVTGLPEDIAVDWSMRAFNALPSLEEALLGAQKRPVVVASQIALSAAEKGESATKMSFLPTASASFTWTAASEVAFSDDRSFWTGRLTTQWPLFLSGARVAENRAAKSRVRMASTQLESIQAQVALQVKTAHADIAVQAQALESAKLILEMSDESLAFVRQSESSGAAHLLDLGLEQVRHSSAEHRVRVANHQLQLSQFAFLIYSGSAVDMF